MIGTKFYKNSFQQKEYTQASNWCNNNNAYIEDMGSYYEVKKAIKTFSEIQQERILFFGQEFARHRDAITWAVQTDGSVFGYDRKSEDVTNFLAAMQRACLGADTYYKVYLNDVDTKAMKLHSYKMFQDVLEQSAQEQIAAYQKYEAIKKQIFEECTTIDELNAITW